MAAVQAGTFPNGELAHQSLASPPTTGEKILRNVV